MLHPRRQEEQLEAAARGEELAEALAMQVAALQQEQAALQQAARAGAEHEVRREQCQQLGWQKQNF